ncbi:hypothetical protein [Hymenobacter baengnokdamensis]|uniref:hypothetical protein n=1 Tax=Hymenobacter baengnokdamensis TaxID=2615203 RepID=UPI0012442371|nr:hypothetical protein [Hymenobacter baengnokdamensis]
MELELVDYLIREHSDKLVWPNMSTIRAFLDFEKLAAIQDKSVRERMRADMIRAGWLSSGAVEALALCEDGTSAVREHIAQKIYDEHGGDALLNKCPRCHRLARTAQAEQCRYCGSNWH